MLCGINVTVTDGVASTSPARMDECSANSVARAVHAPELIRSSLADTSRARHVNCESFESPRVRMEWQSSAQKSWP